MPEDKHQAKGKGKEPAPTPPPPPTAPAPAPATAPATAAPAPKTAQDRLFDILFAPKPPPPPPAATGPLRFDLPHREDDGTWHDSDEEHLAALPVGSRILMRARRLCVGCGQKGASFTCPRCNGPYCGLPCYRSHNGGKCRSNYDLEKEKAELRGVKAGAASAAAAIEALNRLKLQDEEGGLGGGLEELAEAAAGAGPSGVGGRGGGEKSAKAKGLISGLWSSFGRGRVADSDDEDEDEDESDADAEDAAPSLTSLDGKDAAQQMLAGDVVEVLYLRQSPDDLAAEARRLCDDARELSSEGAGEGAGLPDHLAVKLLRLYCDCVANRAPAAVLECVDRAQRAALAAGQGAEAARRAVVKAAMAAACESCTRQDVMRAYKAARADFYASAREAGFPESMAQLVVTHAAFGHVEEEEDEDDEGEGGSGGDEGGGADDKKDRQVRLAHLAMRDAAQALRREDAKKLPPAWWDPPTQGQPPPPPPALPAARLPAAPAPSGPAERAALPFVAAQVIVAHCAAARAARPNGPVGARWWDDGEGEGEGGGEHGPLSGAARLVELSPALHVAADPGGALGEAAPPALSREEARLRWPSSGTGCVGPLIEMVLIQAGPRGDPDLALRGACAAVADAARLLAHGGLRAAVRALADTRALLAAAIRAAQAMLGPQEGPAVAAQLTRASIAVAQALVWAAEPPVGPPRLQPGGGGGGGGGGTLPPSMWGPFLADQLLTGRCIMVAQLRSDQGPA